jgi:O-methyltransferase
MIGLSRLDDLQRCVESAVRDGVEGDLIEAGAWRGGASILIRATLDSLGAGDRTVWVADSFQGFPAPDAEGYPADSERDLHTIDFLAVPLDEVRAHFARFGLDRGVNFVPGFFQETLPKLRGRRWSLVRLDGDTYESTWIALEALYRGVPAGGRRLPRAARDQRAARVGRLERRPLAPRGRGRGRARRRRGSGDRRREL